MPEHTMKNTNISLNSAFVKAAFVEFKPTISPQIDCNSPPAKSPALFERPAAIPEI